MTAGASTAATDQVPGPLKVLAVGVGGQGVLTVARFLGDTALGLELPVRVGQLHGMSQRGGSVEATVLLGPGHTAFVSAGEADVVLGLEPLEVLRARPRMSPRTQVLVNVGRIVPYPLAMQGLGYPDLGQLLDQIREVSPQVIEIDGPSLSAEAGSARSANIVMLGALAALDVLPFDAAALWATIEGRSAPRFVDHNRRAFELGQRAARSAVSGPR